MKSLILASVLFAAMQGQATFQRGELVHLKDEPRMPGAQIVAMPGDRMRVDDLGVYVNGQVVPWISAETRSHLPKPWEPELIAEGQYVLVGSIRQETNGTLIKGDYWAYTGSESFEKLKQ